MSENISGHISAIGRLVWFAELTSTRFNKYQKYPARFKSTGKKWISTDTVL